MRVQSLRLVKPGFVSVFTVNRYGKKGNLQLGHTDLLPADQYEDFTIDLDNLEQNGEIALHQGNSVIVVIFEQGPITEENKQGFYSENQYQVNNILGQPVDEVITLF